MEQGLCSKGGVDTKRRVVCVCNFQFVEGVLMGGCLRVWGNWIVDDIALIIQDFTNDTSLVYLTMGHQ